MDTDFIGIVQTTDAPVFAGTVPTGRSLVCTGCKKMVLIEHYDANAYLGFGISCHGCNAVTFLPSLADGEIFPNRVLTLGDKGQYCISKPVSVHPGIVVTTDRDIEKQQELTHPRQLPETLPFGEALLKDTETRYDNITGGALERQSASVLRAICHGNEFAAEEHPLVWACIHLRSRLASGAFDIADPSDAYAYQVVTGFRSILRNWSHHPRFAAVAASFAGEKSFNHNLALFATAGYLLQHGNSVTLMPTQPMVRTADLYARSGADLIRIEVKAPAELHWPRLSGDISIDAIERIVRRQLQGVTGQIDSYNHGALVIATGIPGEKIGAALSEGIQRALTRFNRSSGVIAVAAANGFLRTMRVEQGTVIQHGFNFIPLPNPCYTGELRFVPASAP